MIVLAKVFAVWLHESYKDILQDAVHSQAVMLLCCYVLLGFAGVSVAQEAH